MPPGKSTLTDEHCAALRNMDAYEGAALLQQHCPMVLGDETPFEWGKEIWYCVPAEHLSGMGGPVFSVTLTQEKCRLVDCGVWNGCWWRWGIQWVWNLDRSPRECTQFFATERAAWERHLEELNGLATDAAHRAGYYNREAALIQQKLKEQHHEE